MHALNVFLFLGNIYPLFIPYSDTENEGQGKDYLYQLINEITTNHNDTLHRFFTAAKERNSLLLPESPLEVLLTEVTSDCLIISNSKE